jgi:hypothetical protein
MRRLGWKQLGLAAGMLLACQGAQAQGYREHPRHQEPHGRHGGFVERQGGTHRFYDRRGDYEGHSERSAGGAVRRFYDSDGRYLGREEVERDFRRRH